MKSAVQDLTVGKPLKSILIFSAPILIGNVFQQLYSTVDTIIVGKTLGQEALAAIGAAGSIQFMVFSLISGLSGGMTVLTSQYVGAGDKKKTHQSISVIYFWGIIAAVLLMVCGMVFLPQMLALLNIPDDIYAQCYQYQYVIFLGMIGNVAYNLFSSIIRALGDSRTPLYFLIISSILNVFGDLIFILNFHLGVSGAAYATILSQAISAILSLIFGLRHFDVMRVDKDSFRISWQFMWKHVTTGVPISIQNSITGIGMIVFQSVLNSMGAAAIAAYTVCSKIDSFATMPMFAIANAVLTFTAQNYGAGLMDRIRKGVKQTFLAELGISIAVAAIIVVFYRQLVGVFISSPDQETLLLCRQYIIGEALGMWCAAFLFVYRAAVQGVGVTRIPMFGGFLELISRTVAALFLEPVIGMYGLGLASPLAWFAASCLNCGYYFHLVKNNFGKSGSTPGLVR